MIAYRTCYQNVRADLAQLVEQLPRKEQVTGSNPVVGSGPFEEVTAPEPV